MNARLLCASIVIMTVSLVTAREFTALQKYSLRSPKVPTLVHLSVPQLRKKAIAELQKFGILNNPEFNAMFKQVVTRERNLVANNKYYVLYHAFDKAWRVPQDLYKQLYVKLFSYPRKGSWEEFRSLRFFTGATVSVSDYLLDTLQYSGMVNDIYPDVKTMMISTNPALFGNIGKPQECTFSYFMEPLSHSRVDEGIFKSILDIWSMPQQKRDQYIQELVDLTQWFTKEADAVQPSSNVLVQLFFPKKMVDKVSYVSWRQGMPPQPELIKWVQKEFVKQIKKKTKAPFVAAADLVTKTLEQEKDKNPLYEKLVDAVRNGRFKTSDFMDTYVKEPEKLLNLDKGKAKIFNAFQMRVFFNEDVLDPGKGVKMFTYDLISEEVKYEYMQRLHSIVNRIVQDVFAQQGLSLADPS